MPGNPIREQRQHPLKVRGFRKTMVGAGKQFQPFRAGESVEESLALVQGDVFIPVALNDQRWNCDCSRRLIGDLVQAVLVESIVEGQTSISSMKVRDRVGFFPFLQSCLSKLQTKFLSEINNRTFEGQAGERRNGCRL